MEKKFISSAIIHHDPVWRRSAGIFTKSSIGKGDKRCWLTLTGHLDTKTPLPDNSTGIHITMNGWCFTMRSIVNVPSRWSVCSQSRAFSFVSSSSVGLHAPSLTTSSYLNPGYRVYQIDGDYPGSSFWTLDHRTVIMNLTATNLYNRTIFSDEYDVRDAYQMENLFPNDWHNLINRLKNDLDGDLMGSVYQYYTKSYASGRECDHACRRGLLCDMLTARDHDPHACDSLPTLSSRSFTEKRSPRKTKLIL